MIRCPRINLHKWKRGEKPIGKNSSPKEIKMAFLRQAWN